MSTTTRWVVDPAQSSAEFRVPHFWGLVKVKGHFDRIGGWLEVDDNGVPSPGAAHRRRQREHRQRQA